MCHSGDKPLDPTTLSNVRCSPGSKAEHAPPFGWVISRTTGVHGKTRWSKKVVYAFRSTMVQPYKAGRERLTKLDGGHGQTSSACRAGKNIPVPPNKKSGARQNSKFRVCYSLPRLSKDN